MAVKSFKVNTKTGEFVPVSPYGWCIIKHLPRGNGTKYDPDEIILQDRPVGGTIGNGIPFQGWWGVSERVNRNNLGAMEWLSTYEAMFFNNDQDPDVREIDKSKPINIRCSSGGGNLKAFHLGTQTSTHVQLVAFDYRYPERANGMDFSTNPELFTYPVAINATGKIIKVAGGINVFVPQICRPEYGLWVRKSEIIILAEKPAIWGIQDVLR